MGVRIVVSVCVCVRVVFIASGDCQVGYRKMVHDSIAVARVTTHSLHSSGCHSDDVLSCHTLKGSDVIIVWSQLGVSSLFVLSPSLRGGGFMNCLLKDSH